ncbi:MAG: hypoxanthine phosphoribosyltransferase [Myxococcota bacterium]
MPRLRPLIDAETLAGRVRDLGRQITEDHRGHEVVIVTVLKGSFMFAADLVRAMDLEVRIDFLGMRSYEGAESSGIVQITSDLTQSIEGRRVIVVEDIVDTGLTMAYLFDVLRTRHPASVQLASLLHKPSRTRVEVPIDYLGFTVDDAFLVGYGLDYDQHYRNLPHLAVLEET